MTSVDVVVVGGGPAGASAALVLGRARKRVLLCDAGAPRNAASRGIGGLLGNDGLDPRDFRARGRAELSRYPSVVVVDELVTDVTGTRGDFVVHLSGRTVHAHLVVLATGVRDLMPELPGLEAVWGASAFGCPHCHGWEVRDRRLAVHAPRPAHVGLALTLTAWSNDVTLLTGGAFGLDDKARARLLEQGVRAETRPLARVCAEGDAVTGVELADGELVPCDALFVQGPQRHVPLVEQLLERGVLALAGASVAVDGQHATPTAGLYAVGDLVRGHQQVVLATAHGAEVAMALTDQLTREWRA